MELNDITRGQTWQRVSDGMKVEIVHVSAIAVFPHVYFVPIGMQHRGGRDRTPRRRSMQHENFLKAYHKVSPE